MKLTFCRGELSWRRKKETSSCHVCLGAGRRGPSGVFAEEERKGSSLRARNEPRGLLVAEGLMAVGHAVLGRPGPVDLACKKVSYLGHGSKLHGPALGRNSG